MSVFTEVSYSFDQVAIKQEKNIVTSRLDVNISSEIIKGIIRPNPLIAANMSSVINADFYKHIYDLGGFAFLHRAQSNESLLMEVKDVAKHCEWVGSSIGVGKSYKELTENLVHAGSNVILIDIAHGYADSVMDLGRWIKNTYPHVKVVVGNTVNLNMLLECQDFADAIKVGIGGGAACTTKDTAGCTEHQWSAVVKFKELSKELGIPVISCGGIRKGADFVKSIGAGANSAMMGSVFAACPESAASTLDGNKIYYGMASFKNQLEWKGGLKPGTAAEGEVRFLPVSNSVIDVMQHYTGSLRSGITYSGTSNIKDFQEQVKWIKLE